MKILFITSTRIGDAVLSTGLLGWLVEHLPAARVTIACGPLAAPLFAALPGLEQVIVLQKQSGGRHWLGLWRACVGARWDLVVDLRRSAVGWLLRSRRRHRLPADPTPIHRVALIGRTLGLDPPPAPRLWTAPDHDAAAARLLGDGGPLLALAPAANWPAKTWPAGRFANLVRRLTGPDGPLAGARVAVACAAAEVAGVRLVMEAVPRDRRVALVGEDLLTIFAVLRQAALFIGNDSGLMHMAAAAGAPTLGLFGPTDERRYGPWGPACAVVRDAAEPAMSSLTVDAVERAVLELCARTGGLERARAP